MDKVSEQALLIVDVQTGFINSETKHLLPIVEQLQAEYEHVYATRFVNKESSPYRKFLGWERFAECSEDAVLAFEPLPGVKVINKTVYTSVSDEFLEELEEKNIKEVFVCGIDTDACVAATAVGLFEHGIRPVILAHACASHAGAEYHNAALRILRRLIGSKQVIQ